jgi:hypothetical protein
LRRRLRKGLKITEVSKKIEKRQSDRESLESDRTVEDIGRKVMHVYNQ